MTEAAGPEVSWGVEVPRVYGSGVARAPRGVRGAGGLGLLLLFTVLSWLD